VLHLCRSQNLYLLSKDLSTLKKSISYSIIVYIFVAIVLSLIGLAIKAKFPGLDPDIALVEGFAQLLPSGLIGLALVVFFAAFMSSIDTYAYTAASSFVHDWFPKLTKAKTVKAIKLAVTAIIAIGSLIAIAIQDLILGSFIFASYAIILAVPTLATWIKPSIKKSTLSISIVIGMIGLTIFTVWGVINNSLTPIIVLEAIAVSLAGLIIGALTSKFFVKTRA